MRYNRNNLALIGR